MVWTGYELVPGICCGFYLGSYLNLDLNPGVFFQNENTLGEHL